MKHVVNEKADDREPPDVGWIDKVKVPCLRKWVKEHLTKGSNKGSQEELRKLAKAHCLHKRISYDPPTDWYPPPKKQKKSKESDNDPSTKSSPETDPYRRCWIYVIWDRRRHVIIYVGQSVDCGRRWQEHIRAAVAEDSKSGLADFLRREQTTTAMLELRLAEGLPNGVAWKDANRWEAFLISKHKTVYDPQNNKRVCNKNNGNGATEVNYEAQEEELTRGYEWPQEEPEAPPRRIRWRCLLTSRRVHLRRAGRLW